MKTQGLPVSLSPAVAIVASNSSHVLYPASDPGFFILEEVESGSTNTLDCTKGGNPVKFVFSRHEVALLTDSIVLFWSLESGNPLESWNSAAQDVYNEYGDWKLVGPNVAFDPVAQTSKNTEVQEKPLVSYKERPVWAGQYLHVGDEAFDIGAFNCISCIHHYIITGFENKITVIFNMKEVGIIEVDEEILALTGMVVDDDLELYFITPTKVAQITAEVDFNPISPVGNSDDNERYVLVSGSFPRREGDAGNKNPKPSPKVLENPEDKAGSELLSLLRNPAPPRPPSTTSLPAASREGFVPPIAIDEQHVNSEDLKNLVSPPIRSLPQNHARPKSSTESDCVSRDYFDSVVATLTHEIKTLQIRISELESSPSQPISQKNAPQNQKKSIKTPEPGTTKQGLVVPASVADAVKKTIEGKRCLQYLEKNMEELRTYLESAPVETSQLMKLVLIDAYHHTKLSKALVDSFGPPIIDANYYNKIIGKECGN